MLEEIILPTSRITMHVRQLHSRCAQGGLTSGGFQALGHDKAQDLIDEITKQYERGDMRGMRMSPILE